MAELRFPCRHRRVERAPKRRKAWRGDSAAGENEAEAAAWPRGEMADAVGLKPTDLRVVPVRTRAGLPRQCRGRHSSATLVMPSRVGAELPTPTAAASLWTIVPPVSIAMRSVRTSPWIVRPISIGSRSLRRPQSRGRRRTLRGSRWSGAERAGVGCLGAGVDTRGNASPCTVKTSPGAVESSHVSGEPGARSAPREPPGVTSAPRDVYGAPWSATPVGPTQTRKPRDTPPRPRSALSATPEWSRSR